MSYVNGTPFLNLPQTVGTDKRDWFDTNEAFLNLDGKLKSAYEGSIDTAAALAELTEVVSGISSDVSDLETTVGNHTTSIATINEALTLINTALNSLNTSVTGKFDSAGIADPYDAEHGIYAINDVVTYNGQRYVCHTAVTAAEPFDADKWTAVDIQTELDQVNGYLHEGETLLGSMKSTDVQLTDLTPYDYSHITIILGYGNYRAVTSFNPKSTSPYMAAKSTELYLKYYDAGAAQMNEIIASVNINANQIFTNSIIVNNVDVTTSDTNWLVWIFAK